MSKFTNKTDEPERVVYENCLPGIAQCPYCKIYMCPFVLYKKHHNFSPGEHTCPACDKTFNITQEDADGLNKCIDEDIEEKKKLLSA